MNKLFNESIDRIKNIHWSNLEFNKPSFELLVSEFIRRGNIFGDLYDINNTKRMAIFNAADVIGEVVPNDIENII